MTRQSFNPNFPVKAAAASRIVWCFGGIVGVFGFAFILYSRFARIGPLDGYGGNAFDLMPMTGLVNGVDPHFLFRLMHNLTHPILAVGYALIITWMAIRVVAKPAITKLSRIFFEAAMIVILALLDAYLGSWLLPVGDLITTNIQH